ncbi:radial spoke head protein, putative [Ichthyophthirius multifiliis]|uniref:Radial spoke head protein, putative n=1 Tax=Ichthyophthirius multifiliis TaxID=5932 RepID=G0QT25_ICHMU|nr:radial spoke head protein, putative [Ichthyophthirius multifiliis]EGR31624.1 radial spoke head protein, putative [Ichthyophthirius multifiliis]|eukprot:XP_004035110.1 radial spoke head protein, putative [Ichthyophthirius multifiliis]
MSTFLKQQLEQVVDNEGRNLYNHLSNVLTKLVLDEPKNAYDVLEDYSHHVKLCKYDFKQHSDFTDNTQRILEKYQDVQESYQKNKKLLSVNIFLFYQFKLKQKNNQQILEGEEDNLAPIGPIGYVPNFMEESKWFEWAGVGFGEELSYRIFRSLTVLSNSKKEKNLKNVRLWGKIHGSQKDYYIAEGQADFEDYGELPPEVEPLGGDEPSVNQMNYYVTTDLVNGEWVELPFITPSQIQTSRKIKYVFTGDLNRKIITNPHFESNVKPANQYGYSVGTEKELLKCQIIRINHCTSIQPKGLKVLDAEDPRVIVDPPEDTFVYPSFENLSKINGWVHNKQNILNVIIQKNIFKKSLFIKEGKLKHTIPNDIEDEDPEIVQKRIEAKDPFEPLLKSLDLDKSPEGYDQSWTIRVYGDSTNYGLFQRQEGYQNYGYIAIKNLYWPGSVTIYHNKKYQNIYVGYGFKQSSETYFPCEPEIILEERLEIPCQIEPVPPEEVKQEETPQANDDQQDDE